MGRRSMRVGARASVTGRIEGSCERMSYEDVGIERMTNAKKGCNDWMDK